jgi:hypothetical protein
LVEERLLRVVSAVLMDLVTVERTYRPRLIVTPGQPDSSDGFLTTSYLVEMWAPTDTYAAVEVHLPDAPEMIEAALPFAAFLVADAVQTELVEQHPNDVRPPCPGHAHAMWAVHRDSAARWQCPAVPERSRPIWPR